MISILHYTLAAIYDTIAVKVIPFGGTKKYMVAVLVPPEWMQLQGVCIYHRNNIGKNNCYRGRGIDTTTLAKIEAEVLRVVALSTLAFTRASRCWVYFPFLLRCFPFWLQLKYLFFIIELLFSCCVVLRLSCLVLACLVLCCNACQLVIESKMLSTGMCYLIFYTYCPWCVKAWRWMCDVWYE